MMVEFLTVEAVPVAELPRRLLEHGQQGWSVAAIFPSETERDMIRGWSTRTTQVTIVFQWAKEGSGKHEPESA